jgi:hypothetical protein
MKNSDQILLESLYEKIHLKENLVSDYASNTHRQMDKFLTQVIKGKEGYFGDDDLNQYNKLKTGLSNIQQTSDSKETFSIRVNYSYYSQVGFGNHGKIGNPAGEKVKTFVIDNKGIWSLTEVGSGKKSSTPTLKFQRDESLTPKSSRDFQDNLQVGDTREDLVIFEGAFETYAYGKKLVINRFKILDKDIKLTSFDKEPLHFKVGDEIRLKYVVKKPNVYKGELSYVVNIKDMDNVSKTTREKTSEDLKKETNEMIRPLFDKINSRNQKELNDKLIQLITNYMHTSEENLLKDYKRQLMELDRESDNS